MKKNYNTSKVHNKHIIDEIQTSRITLPESESKKAHRVKVKLEDGKKLAELMRDGYTPVYSDDEIWILEKVE